MPTSCIAIGCANRSTKKAREEHGITFHKLPQDKTLRDEWLKSIRRKNFDPSQTQALFICSEHFLPTDYEVSQCFIIHRSP